MKRGNLCYVPTLSACMHVSMSEWSGMEWDGSGMEWDEVGAEHLWSCRIITSVYCTYMY